MKLASFAEVEGQTIFEYGRVTFRHPDDVTRYDKLSDFVPSEKGKSTVLREYYKFRWRLIVRVYGVLRILMQFKQEWSIPFFDFRPWLRVSKSLGALDMYGTFRFIFNTIFNLLMYSEISRDLCYIFGPRQSTLKIQLRSQGVLLAIIILSCTKWCLYFYLTLHVLVENVPLNHVYGNCLLVNLTLWMGPILKFD